MMYDLLADLLPLLGQYQEATPADRQSVQDFAAWVRQRAAPTAPPATPHAAARTPPHPYETEGSVLVKLLTFMHRYVRGYVRLALADTPLVGFDDFSYLIALFGSGPLTRTELMRRNIHEKATGTEVIRRLLRHGLVSEEPHATDRRRKQLCLSETGRTMLFSVTGRMALVAQMGAGDLSATERHELLHLLHRLDAFHFPVFAEARPATFAALVAECFPGVEATWPPLGAENAPWPQAPKL